MCFKNLCSKYGIYLVYCVVSFQNWTRNCFSHVMLYGCCRLWRTVIWFRRILLSSQLSRKLSRLHRMHVDDKFTAWNQGVFSYSWWRSTNSSYNYVTFFLNDSQSIIFARFKSALMIDSASKVVTSLLSWMEYSPIDQEQSVILELTFPLAFKVKPSSVCDCSFS